jgi:uncharacterized membrane protein
MWLDYLFIFSCHQLDGRSPSLGGEFFPVCFRCAGIYFGIFSVYFSLFFFRKVMIIPLSKKNILYLSLLFLPLMIDGAANYIGLWISPPILRIITGLSAGIFLAAVLIPFLKIQKNNNNFSLSGFIFAFFLGITLAFLLFQTKAAIIFDSLKYAAALGLLFYMGGLFLVIRNFKSSY